MKQQQDFYRYVASHTPQQAGSIRRWRLTPRQVRRLARVRQFAIPWGWQDKTQLSEAEQQLGSAEDVYYPLSKPGDGAVHTRLRHRSRRWVIIPARPWAMSTLLPIESDVKLLEHYGALAFMGYHCAEAKRL